MTNGSTNGDSAPPSPSASAIIVVGVAYFLIFVLAVFLLNAYIVAPQEQVPGSTSPEQTTNETTTASLTSTQKKDFVQAVAITLAGAVAAVGVYFTWRTLETTLWSSRRNIQHTQESLTQTSQTLLQNQRTQSADRFIRAIDQVGSENPAIRLGGIYALDQIAKENEEYRGRIIEVLSTYIRTNYRRRRQSQSTQTPLAGSELSEAQGRSEVNAILLIFKRTLKSTGQPYQSADNTIGHVDLHGTDLRNADLRDTDLQEANLTDTYLHAAELKGTILRNANLANSDLTQAVLESAHLQGANFRESTLQYADLRNIKEWDQITDLELANVEGVENAPDGFVEWAKAKGAV